MVILRRILISATQTTTLPMGLPGIMEQIEHWPFIVSIRIFIVREGFFYQGYKMV